jgi:hypothetical protein
VFLILDHACSLVTYRSGLLYFFFFSLVIIPLLPVYSGWD